MIDSKLNAVPLAQAASVAVASKKNGVFSFPNSIRLRLSDSLAQNYGAVFCKTVRSSAILETRFLSILDPNQLIEIKELHLISKERGRFSRERPIIVSEEKPELYLWTGQGRQAFIIPLLPDEYERARCKQLTPEQRESEVRVEVAIAAIPSDQCPVIDRGIPKKPQVYDHLNPDMIECFLRLKKGLPARQRSVTVARFQSEITALHAGYNASDMYQLWFVGMKVAIQPHQRSNIPRTNIDHNHLEALLTRAGYTFDDFGNLVDGDDVKTIEPLPQQLPIVIEEVHVDHIKVASEVAPIEIVTAVQETTVTTDTDWQSLSLGSILGSIDVISVLQAQLNALEENVNLQTQTVNDAQELLDQEKQKLAQLQGQLAACRDEANKTPLLSLLQTGDARNHLKELVDFLNQLMK